MSTDRNPYREFMDLFGDLPILVGLRQQGHLPTVERMLSEGRSWEEIGKAIGWDGGAAQRWYALERARGCLSCQHWGQPATTGHNGEPGWKTCSLDGHGTPPDYDCERFRERAASEGEGA